MHISVIIKCLKQHILNFALHPKPVWDFRSELESWDLGFVLKSGIYVTNKIMKCAYT